VIGGRAGGVQEAVLDGETGLLVDGSDIEQLSQAIVKLLADQEYATKLGLAGKKRVMEQFGWSNRAEAVRQLGLRVVAHGTDSTKIAEGLRH
jgi:phosphatidylinositol alpha-1,6-mannosyltransferase